MNDEQVRERLRAAIGEPPGASDAVRRLETHLYAPEGRTDHWPERAYPRPMALVAVVLGLLLVAGLLATQAARARRAAPAPATTPAGAPPTPAATCLVGAPAQLVVIDLAAQRLTAYDHGCPMLTTLVTTGKPGLPTTTGTFLVLSKSPKKVLHSAWPPGSPNWYPDTTVSDYIAFTGAGDALHSAEWEPADEYGPGSQNGPYAGTTVHVPLDALQRLYAWVQIGAAVVVKGD
jgi:hypothetical protein